MNNKTTNFVLCIVLIVFFFGFSLLCLFMPKPEFLDSERRDPAAFPELTLGSVMKDGVDYEDSFMKAFDDKYTPDNFPFRDAFRSLKGFVVNYLFNHKDKDGIFMVDGYIAEMQETVNKVEETQKDPATGESVKVPVPSYEYAAKKFKFIYDMYLKNKNANTYLSIIPDKAYFLAEKNGYLSMDYADFIKKMTESADFAEYIDITGALSIEDYYKTDTHWRQEKLTDVAALLVDSMGGNYDSKYDKNTLEHPFYGVYSGRVGRPVYPETIYYLTNENMKNIKVTDYQNGGKEISLYDMVKAEGKDPYDMFLSGELSKVTIENANAKTNKELVVFRDSYGRSLIPLLADDYAKITVVDIRYAHPMMLLGDVNFENADVLFLYSTLVLNNSGELK